MFDEYAIVFGDETMGFYKNGDLMVAATKLTFGDIVEHCGISCDLIEADLDIYDDPTKLPQRLEDVQVI